MGMTRFQAHRMIWIDAWLTRSEFPLNRRHLESAFDISIPSCAVDFSRFMDMFPDRMAYDFSAKCYRPVAGSDQVYPDWMHEAVLSAGRAAKEACDR